MATRPNKEGGASAPPQQPGLRPFIVYDCLPAGCIAFPVTDGRAEPLLRPGDIAVVDASDKIPAEGELFVIEWGRPYNPHRRLVEMWTREFHGADGKPFTGWMVGAYNRPRTYQAAMEEARRTGVLRGGLDGPYRTDGEQAAYLPSILVGKVIGTLEPRFEEPKRLGSAVQS